MSTFASSFASSSVSRSVPTSSIGVLALHGLTGEPVVLGPTPDRLRAAGVPVSTPTLPGHGTTPADLVGVTWDDWSGAVERELDALLRTVPRAVVLGLSMGGTLALWIAARRPEVAGVIAINAPARPEPDFAATLTAALDGGMTMIDPFGGDLEDPSVHAPDYGVCPTVAMLEMLRGVDALQEALPTITCPALLIASEKDDTVAAMDNRAHVAERLAGPVDTLDLTRGRHLATIDYDRDIIADAAVAFVQSLGAAPAV